MLKKGYQEFSDIESSVTTKVKGVLSTEDLPDDAFSNLTNPDMYPYYRRVWDVADYVIPSSESNAFFVMTNTIITPNQTLGVCSESAEVRGSECVSDADCTRGKMLYLANGKFDW